ncbi:MAG: FMN-binding protein, partial [Chthoniobacteraceae bacterium]
GRCAARTAARAPQALPATRRRRYDGVAAAMKRVVLQLYRLAVLVVIAWIIRVHAVHLRVSGMTPVTLEEVRAVLPEAVALSDDPGERSGVFIHDGKGAQIGHAVRTAPMSDPIIGYCGWTDSLIVLDPGLRVLGVRVRSSQDTRDHVGDVKGDPYFLKKTWKGKPWDEVARVTPEEAGIEGVAGATMTSLAVAEGVQKRLRAWQAEADSARPIRWRIHDYGIVAVTLAAIVLAFLGTHGRAWLRRGFQVLVIVYVGFITGDLLAQSLIVGWAQNGAPWRSAPGLVLLLAASLAVPWATGKAIYCQHLCPHGAAQEILHKFAPRGWRLHIRADIDRALRWLPAGLLAVVLAAAMLALPIDLAHLEPFDAYVISAAGVATIAIAIAGLVASLFVPMAYCHYGCPTGALLNFIRGHGAADSFSRRDVSALLLVTLAWLLSHFHLSIHAWMVS